MKNENGSYEKRVYFFLTTCHIQGSVKNAFRLPCLYWMEEKMKEFLSNRG